MASLPITPKRDNIAFPQIYVDFLVDATFWHVQILCLHSLQCPLVAITGRDGSTNLDGTSTRGLNRGRAQFNPLITFQDLVVCSKVVTILGKFHIHFIHPVTVDHLVMSLQCTCLGPRLEYDTLAVTSGSTKAYAVSASFELGIMIPPREYTLLFSNLLMYMSSPSGIR